MKMEISADLEGLRTQMHLLRQAERGGVRKTVGFVPTMGALHRGHMALVQQSMRDGHHTVASIFVNPKQFGAGEDLSRYPRPLEQDQAMLEQAGVRLLFLPTVEGVYPAGFATHVRVGGIAEHLCGPFRPGHFEGVATVVARLLNAVGADAAYFGEKDWQQLQIVKRLARDLAIPTHIIGVPTCREEDGLALSSRNVYLSAEERVLAAQIPATLQRLATAIAAQPGQAEKWLEQERTFLTDKGFVLDYLELADAQSCAPVRNLARSSRVFIAARLGKTRLIDNWPL